MSGAKTERLLNLVLALLSTRRWLSYAAIRDAVPGYDATDEETGRRTFERDKADLRELGIPLETGSFSVWDDEPGYRIARRNYELPEIDLEPDEAAAVGLAARLWAEAGLATDASRALVKLRAAGVDVDGPQLPGLEPRVEASDPAFEAMVDSATAGRPVAFTYRSRTADSAGRRRLEPWGVVSWHGHWYVVGHDLDRDARRVFRLSRVTGAVTPIGVAGSVTVPADVDLRAVVREVVPDSPEHSARLRLRTGTGYDIRRRAQATTPLGDGWDDVVLTVRDAESMADEVVAHGTAVEVLEPPELRAAVRARLRLLAQR